MSKNTKILLLTLCGVFLATGLILLIFYSRSSICGGLACISLGLGMIVLAIHNKYQYDEKLKELNEFTQDFLLETKENNDEDYDMKNENKAVKKMYAHLKKTDRTHISLFVSGSVLFILAFFIF